MMASSGKVTLKDILYGPVLFLLVLFAIPIAGALYFLLVPTPDIPLSERENDMASNGLGKSLCAAWLVERSKPDDPELEYWMVGFLNAGHYIDVGHPEKPPHNVYRWIDGYCIKNPLGSLGSAAKAFGAAHGRLTD
jgi:hypothetical protein